MLKRKEKKRSNKTEIREESVRERRKESKLEERIGGKE